MFEDIPFYILDWSMALVIAFIGGGWIFYDIRRRHGQDYLIEVVILTKKANYHVMEITKKLEYLFQFWGQGYRISREALYDKEPSKWTRFIKNIRGSYLIIFYEGNAEPLSPKEAEISPLILEKVRTSTVLGRALKDLFRSNFLEGRGLIFWIILFVVVVAIVLKMRGYI